MELAVFAFLCSTTTYPTDTMSMMEKDQSAIVETSMFLFVARLDEKIS